MSAHTTAIGAIAEEFVNRTIPTVDEPSAGSMNDSRARSCQSRTFPAKPTRGQPCSEGIDSCSRKGFRLDASRLSDVYAKDFTGNLEWAP